MDGASKYWGTEWDALTEDEQNKYRDLVGTYCSHSASADMTIEWAEAELRQRIKRGKLAEFISCGGFGTSWLR